MGTERQTNVIINVHFACSEEELPCVQKCKQVCVSKLLSVLQFNGNLTFIFFMCLIDMNKFFEKTSMTFETCLGFMLYVDYGFNNKHTFA